VPPLPGQEFTVTRRAKATVTSAVIGAEELIVSEALEAPHE